MQLLCQRIEHRSCILKDLDPKISKFPRPVKREIWNPRRSGADTASKRRLRALHVPESG